MMHGHTRQALRIVDSAARALQTWQKLQRSSGSDVPVELALSAVSSASMIGSMLGPPPFAMWEAPERLDVRTRLGFFLQSIGTLGCAGAIVRAVLQHDTWERQEHAWHRHLARQSIWRRLTATRVPGRDAAHGRLFTVVAAALALLSGFAKYRSAAQREPLGEIFGVLPSLAGRIFPTLPVFGVARPQHSHSLWFSAFGGLSALAGTIFAIRSLRTAFMSQAQYEEQRRLWIQRREGAS